MLIYTTKFILRTTLEVIQHCILNSNADESQFFVNIIQELRFKSKVGLAKIIVIIEKRNLTTKSD